MDYDRRKHDLRADTTDIPDDTDSKLNDLRVPEFSREKLLDEIRKERLDQSDRRLQGGADKADDLRAFGNGEVPELEKPDEVVRGGSDDSPPEIDSPLGRETADRYAQDISRAEGNDRTRQGEDLRDGRSDVPSRDGDELNNRLTLHKGSEVEYALWAESVREGERAFEALANAHTQSDLLGAVEAMLAANGSRGERDAYTEHVREHSGSRWPTIDVYDTDPDPRRRRR